jgi:hypothetical protein
MIRESRIPQRRDFAHRAGHAVKQLIVARSTYLLGLDVEVFYVWAHRQ